MTWQDAAHPEVRSAMEAALEVLRGLGATVKEISLKLVKHAVPLQLLTSDSDIASMMLERWLRTRYRDFDVGTRTRLAAGCLIPATIYHRAMRARALVRQEVLDAFKGCDALLAPTNFNPPGLNEAVREKVESADDMDTRVLMRRISCYPFSMANVPAIAVPMGYTRAGLPVSLQIAGKPFDESMVFRVAHAHERATAWHKRHPDLDRTLARAKEAA
jgi:aspartyl-tRNA(Asn)/glutamyl-tRNA(Gln) amidotransferase subunit A